MRKLISLTTIALAVAFTTNSGCTKPGDTTPVVNPLTILPDIANFTLQAITSFVPGAAAGVTFSAPNLGAGTFTINYNLTSSTTGADNLSNLTATFTMAAGATTGTFNTQTIPQGGNVSMTINSISNSSGSSAISNNNTKAFSDSTGLMTYTYTPHGGATQSMRATDVNAVLAGTNLQIVGIIWAPNLTTVTLRDLVFTGSNGSVSFNINDLTPGSLTSTFNGSAVFQLNGSTLINDLSAHGTITFTGTSPLLTGTFTYTNMPDSSVVTGTFSCPHP